MFDDNGKNFYVSVACGIIFGVAWWLMIDVLAYDPSTVSYRHGILFIPAVLSSVSLIGNNLIPNSSLVDNFTVTRLIVCHRFAFFFAMALGFAGLLASIIMCAIAREEEFPMYARIAIPVQNALILASNLMFKFATTDGTEDSF